jgi:hypothetical protein
MALVFRITHLLIFYRFRIAFCKLPLLLGSRLGHTVNMVLSVTFSTSKYDSTNAATRGKGALNEDEYQSCEASSV